LIVLFVETIDFDRFLRQRSRFRFFRLPQMINVYGHPSCLAGRRRLPQTPPTLPCDRRRPDDRLAGGRAICVGLHKPVLMDGTLGAHCVTPATPPMVLGRDMRLSHWHAIKPGLQLRGRELYEHPMRASHRHINDDDDDINGSSGHGHSCSSACHIFTLLWRGDCIVLHAAV